MPSSSRRPTTSTSSASATSDDDADADADESPFLPEPAASASIVGFRVPSFPTSPWTEEIEQCQVEHYIASRQEEFAFMKHGSRKQNQAKDPAGESSKNRSRYTEIIEYRCTWSGRPRDRRDTIPNKTGTHRLRGASTKVGCKARFLIKELASRPGVVEVTYHWKHTNHDPSSLAELRRMRPSALPPALRALVRSLPRQQSTRSLPRQESTPRQEPQAPLSADQQDSPPPRSFRASPRRIAIDIGSSDAVTIAPQRDRYVTASPRSQSPSSAHTHTISQPLLTLADQHHNQSHHRLDRLRVAISSTAAAAATRRDVGVEEASRTSLENCIPVPLYGSRDWKVWVYGGDGRGDGDGDGDGRQEARLDGPDHDDDDDDEMVVVDDDHPPSPMDVTPFLPDAARPSDTTYSDREVAEHAAVPRARGPTLTDLLVTIRRKHEDTTRKLETLSAAAVSGTSALESTSLMERLVDVLAGSAAYQNVVDEWADAETAARGRVGVVT